MLKLSLTHFLPDSGTDLAFPDCQLRVTSAFLRKIFLAAPSHTHKLSQRSDPIFQCVLGPSTLQLR